MGPPRANCKATLQPASKSPADFACAFDGLLRNCILPYWLATTVDRERGGYTLNAKYHTFSSRLAGILRRLAYARAGHSRLIARERPLKCLVSTCRMLWGLAHAHRLGYSDTEQDYLEAACMSAGSLTGSARGYSDTEQDYLEAAAHGYRYLCGPLFDRVHGGYYWAVDVDGRPADTRKFLYGQSFVIYALVEYHRASGLNEPLERALALFARIEHALRDEARGGWYEQAASDFTLLTTPSTNGQAHTWVGYHSADTVMHWMEALTPLAQVTGDAAVRRALADSVDLATARFFPVQPIGAPSHYTLDWTPVTLPNHDGWAPGVALEFAWLLVNAQRALGQAPDWERLARYVDTALDRAYDWGHGGFYARVASDGTIIEPEKLWWVQAETLAALAYGVSERPTPRRIEALERLLVFIWNHVILPNGLWVWSTDPAGRILNRTVAGHWKAAYHDLRAMNVFIQTFLPARRLPPDA